MLQGLEGTFTLFHWETHWLLKIGWSNFRTAILGLQPFNNPQTEAWTAIPHYRILLETDSPYMPVSLHHGTNTPAYLGDIARIDAHH